jgi:hypothetical protein
VTDASEHPGPAVTPRQRATTVTALVNALRHRNRVDVTSVVGCVEAVLNGIRASSSPAR